MQKYVFEYPAFTNQFKGRFVGMCPALNIIGLGFTEEECVQNITTAVSKCLPGYYVIIIPVKVTCNA